MRNCRSAVQKCWRSWPADRLPFRRCTGRPQRPAPRPWCCRPRTAPQRAGPAPGPHSPKPCTGPAGLRPAGGSHPFRWRGLFSGRAVPSVIAAAFQRLPAGLPEAVVTVQLIELCRQRAFASFLPPMQACAAMTGGFGKIRVSPRRVAMKKSPFQGCFSLEFVL